MGNSQSDKYTNLETSLHGKVVSSEKQIEEILRHYTHFDNRNDHRFEDLVLYKSIGDVFIAKINHMFDDYESFIDYIDMYERRRHIESKCLLPLKNVIKIKEEDFRGDRFIIHLFIEYPYNDLKNEIAYRKLKGREFSERELLKILKAGVEALYRLKQARFNYRLVIDQHSICLFDKPYSDTFRVKILEFSVKGLQNGMFEQSEEKLEENYIANCKYIALAVLEAAFLINEMIIYRNTSDFILYRIIDEFQSEYDDPDLSRIVEGFLKENMGLEEAFNIFDKRKHESQRYVYVDNKILKNEEINPRQSKRKSIVQDLMNPLDLKSILK